MASLNIVLSITNILSVFAIRPETLSQWFLKIYVVILSQFVLLLHVFRAVIFMNEERTEEAKEIRVQRPLLSRIIARFKGPEVTEMPVSAVMRKGVIVANSSVSIAKCAEQMARNKVGSLVIMEKGKAIGIVTERDLVRKVVAKGRKASTAVPVKKIMSTPMRVIEQNKSVIDAVAIMKRYGVKRLPVIDAQKKLVGIVTDNDITRAVPSMIDLLTEVYNVQRYEAMSESVGICDKCGQHSETLMNLEGEFLCEECREEESDYS